MGGEWKKALATKNPQQIKNILKFHDPKKIPPFITVMDPVTKKEDMWDILDILCYNIKADEYSIIFQRVFFLLSKMKENKAALTRKKTKNFFSTLGEEFSHLVRCPHDLILELLDLPMVIYTTDGSGRALLNHALFTTDNYSEVKKLETVSPAVAGWVLFILSKIEEQNRLNKKGGAYLGKSIYAMIDDAGNTPLHLAAAYCDKGSFAQDIFYPLATAAKLAGHDFSMLSGKEENKTDKRYTVFHVLAKKFSEKNETSFYETPLMYLLNSLKNAVPKEKLCEWINTFSSSGATAFYYAIQANRTPTLLNASFLQELGANCRSYSSPERDPLDLILNSKDISVMKHFLNEDDYQKLCKKLPLDATGHPKICVTITQNQIEREMFLNPFEVFMFFNEMEEDVMYLNKAHQLTLRYPSLLPLYKMPPEEKRSGSDFMRNLVRDSMQLYLALRQDSTLLKRMDPDGWTLAHHAVLITTTISVVGKDEQKRIYPAVGSAQASLIYHVLFELCGKVNLDLKLTTNAGETPLHILAKNAHVPAVFYTAFEIYIRKAFEDPLYDFSMLAREGNSTQAFLHFLSRKMIEESKMVPEEQKPHVRQFSFAIPKKPKNPKQAPLELFLEYIQDRKDLLERVDLNVFSGSGATPFFYALNKKQLRSAFFLLSLGADPTLFGENRLGEEPRDPLAEIEKQLQLRKMHLYLLQLHEENKLDVFIEQFGKNWEEKKPASENKANSIQVSLEKYLVDAYKNLRNSPDSSVHKEMSIKDFIKRTTQKFLSEREIIAAYVSDLTDLQAQIKKISEREKKEKSPFALFKKGSEKEKPKAPDPQWQKKKRDSMNFG